METDRRRGRDEATALFWSDERSARQALSGGEGLGNGEEEDEALKVTELVLGKKYYTGKRIGGRMVKVDTGWVCVVSATRVSPTQVCFSDGTMATIRDGSFSGAAGGHSSGDSGRPSQSALLAAARRKEAEAVAARHAATAAAPSPPPTAVATTSSPTETETAPAVDELPPPPVRRRRRALLAAMERALKKS